MNRSPFGVVLDLISYTWLTCPQKVLGASRLEAIIAMLKAIAILLSFRK